jgi:hypothetical protein
MLAKILKGFVNLVKVFIFTIGCLVILGWALLSCDGTPGANQNATVTESNVTYWEDVEEDGNIAITFDELFGLNK